MPFPTRLLTEGEEIVVDTRPHWIALVGPVLVTIVLVVAEVLALTHIHGHSGARSILRWVLAGAGLLLFLAYPVRTFIKWATSHFVITTQRLVHRVGLIAHGSMEIPLSRITDVRFDQNILQRMIGAGTLVIESAGERGSEAFDNVRRPEFIQKTLYERARAGERQAAAPAAPAASPAEELARLADLRDRGVLSEEEFQAQKSRLLGS
jgi:uncharacterized membrane protein YdbT with pleckstrin-like domain